MTTKSVAIKDAGAKSGGRVSKAVELIAGELLHGLEFVTVGGVSAAGASPLYRFPFRLPRLLNL
jgi:hypothetical protein